MDIKRIYKIFFKKKRKGRINASILDIFDKDYKASYTHFLANILSMVDSKRDSDIFTYLTKSYHLKSALKKSLDSKKMFNISYKSNRLNNIFGATFLVILLFSFLYKLIPIEQEVIHLGVFSIYNNGFTDLNTFVWFFMRKLTMVLAMSVWLVFCESWWRYSIFSAIILYGYQFWEAFQDEKFLDAYGNIRALPYILGIILIIVSLSKVVKYQIRL